MLAARRRRRWSVVILLLAAALLLASLPLGRCQEEEDDSSTDNGSRGQGLSSLFITVIYDLLQNVTSIFATDIGQRFDFCVKDTDREWNEAFNFTSDLTFLSNCAESTKGDLNRRLCTSAEVQFYFDSFNEIPGKKKFLKPNLNCNKTSWLAGCEPGWSCTVAKDATVNVKEQKTIPVRSEDCTPCCEGFFCPRGITCMIPCPLGAYCPLAKLNTTTGICDPYTYQLPPGQPNHTCGTADTWLDVATTGEMFCPPGYFCPSTIEKISCSSGHYCRKGSITPTTCFQKSSCPPNSTNQDITIFGALLMVALSLLLLVIYNFSGQMLTSRERKQAKSREAAAKYARETVQARERWKSAKEVAKKHAVGLQTQLSRTFSRKKSTKPAEPKAFGNQIGSAIGEKKEGNNNLTQMVQSIEDNPDSYEGFNMEIGDKNLKKNMPKGKQMHTRSQIFKYAYGQIEKEKAMEQQNKNLTFSGVISMATTGEESRLRPPIEVAFKDLTLTLKGSKKKLLRSVTGKLHPGHVAAVMGPSGAGKTTFLSAVAGKAPGCEVTGQVLINGKAEPIRSYKKIIGFVPQDDIVHGNLTVEENLWFSARCRLSADLPKAEKVLVVERVIESLGLQAIRDSLVGTVEKRGISGGQRKRVNVGLEMVMEPSLLILDEPTSGLDSSSSQLLLRALKREAAEGVNICMVLHQPSYTLFKMFDDLILLAKGGLTAYHGSVKNLEEYFSGLGMNVPDRVNPPDYFIDILEGILKPNSEVSYKELPLRWMMHNGYTVPTDMMQEFGDLDASEKGTPENASDSGVDSVAGDGDGAGAGAGDGDGDGDGAGADAGPGADAEPRQSFAGEVWGNVKDIVGQKKDEYEYQFSKSKDLSERNTPGVFQQYRYFLGRVGKQRLREARIQGVDFLILCLAGVCLGTLAKMSDDTFGLLGYTYTIIAVSLLCKIGALRSFSLEKLEYWRERASGMSSLAYFLARDTIDHFNTLIKPIVYLSMFYFFNNPRSSILDNYIILVSLVYCVTGIGYFFAIFFQPGSAQLWSALLPVVLTLIATQGNTSKLLTDLCYTKWALEAFVIANAERYSGVWLITRCSSLLKSDYDIADWELCLIILIVYGIVCRCIAFFCMVAFQKK